MIYRDSESFTDAFGCAFASCVGYQSPYPVVCLGRAGGPDTVSAVLTLGGAQQNTNARLVKLQFSDTNPCTSFRELIAGDVIPLASSPFYRHVEVTHEMSWAVYRGAAGGWRTSLFMPKDNHVREIMVEGTQLCSISGKTMWAIREQGEAAMVVAAPLGKLFGRGGSAAAPIAIPGATSVLGLTTWSACTVGAGGAMVVDKRVSSVPQRHLSAPLLGGVLAGTEGNVLVSHSRDNHIMVSDLRMPGALLLDYEVPQYVKLRGYGGSDVVLLATETQVGILNTTSLTVTHAIQCSDGYVLDALPVKSERGHYSVCCSESTGIVSMWQVPT